MPNDVEQRRGRLDAADLLRAVGAVDVDRNRLGERQRVERSRLRLPLQIVERMHVDRAVTVAKRFAKDDETIGAGVGERPQRHRVEEREDGRVRADAQAEREHCHRGEARMPAQAADRIARILQQRLEPHQPVGVTTLVLPSRQAAEIARRGVARRLEGHAARDEGVDLSLEVVAQLSVQLPFDLAASKEGSQTKSKGSRPAHVRILEDQKVQGFKGSTVQTRNVS